MRFLRLEDHGQINLTKEFRNEIPCYAILSHTWGADEDEVTFNDLVIGTGRDKAGFAKISFCANQARKDGLQYIWIDACCIDRANHTELSTAVASMFRWYRDAAKCYVYLSDVSTERNEDNEQQESWKPALRHSRWFRRGWTLQELLAPRSVEFFSSEGRILGDKSLLEDQIREITGIPPEALRGEPLSNFDVKERMQWAKGRKTTLKEDGAYCLQGIFGVFMPLIYGEGGNAFARLEEAIDRCLEKEYIEPAPKRKKNLSHQPYTKHGRNPLTQELLLESLCFDQINDRLMNIPPSQARTCEWLFESTEFLDWLNDDKYAEHHGFFWIKGKAGCGKSTLMKFIFTKIKKFTSNSPVLCYFFNARGAHLEKSTIGLYRSLVVQLLQKCELDERLLDDILHLNGYLSIDQLKTNREIVKQIFLHVTASMHLANITIVIDALDECDEVEVRDMIAFLQMLGENSIATGEKMIRVLLASRHYPHITVRPAIKMILENQHGHFEDIDKYVARRLQIGQGRQADQVRQEIHNRASGVFLWVVLVVQDLNRAFDSGHVHTIRERLQEIPTLNDLFLRMLTRDCEHMDEMKLCLQWILFAGRPLKREELYFAILSGTRPATNAAWNSIPSSEEVMDLFILSSSKGLAEITKSVFDSAQFIHELVPDFLLRKNGLGQLWTDLGSNATGLSHDRLKECCENFIRLNVLSHPNHFDTSGQALPLPLLIDTLRANAPAGSSFLNYSLRYILAHAESAQAEKVDQERFLNEFLLSEWAQLSKIWVWEKHDHYRRELNDMWEEPDYRHHYLCSNPLVVLAEKNCPNLLTIVMRDRPCTRSRTRLYSYALYAALRSDHEKVAEQLTNASFARANMQHCLNKTLEIASANCHKGVVELLIDRGAEVTVKVLQLASAGSHYDIRREILSDKSAEYHAQGGKGVYGSALWAARETGHQKIVELLLSREPGKFSDALTADSALAEYQMQLMLLEQQDKKRMARVAELILDKGINVNEQTGNYGNALQVASLANQNEIVRVLLDGGADVNMKGGKYGTALQAASSQGHIDVVRLLLDRGADPNL
ncbi:MAG: hypothetical protein M1821_000256 [Bathelium mastoideum]|nr:MAG: hypothetical protein M1821_000256 [Bathelium mastoideum]